MPQPMIVKEEYPKQEFSFTQNAYGGVEVSCKTVHHVINYSPKSIENQ